MNSKPPAAMATPDPATPASARGAQASSVDIKLPPSVCRAWFDPLVPDPASARDPGRGSVEARGVAQAGAVLAVGLGDALHVGQALPLDAPAAPVPEFAANLAAGLGAGVAGSGLLNGDLVGGDFSPLGAGPPLEKRQS